MSVDLVFKAPPGGTNLVFGADAGPNTALVLFTEPGVFNVTGFDGSEDHGVRLDVVPTSLTVVGYNANMKLSRKLRVQPTPNFTLAFTPASVIPSKRITTIPESFSITGFPASTGRTYAMFTTPGTFNTVGRAADFVVLGRSFQTTIGTLSYSGSPSNITISRKLLAGVGEFNVVAPNVKLQYELGASTPGEFEITGFPATFNATRYLKIVPRVFSINAIPVDSELEITKTLEIQPAHFDITGRAADITITELALGDRLLETLPANFELRTSIASLKVDRVVTKKYKPVPFGPVLLQMRDARRSRLWAGGTFFRSIELEERANRIEVTCVEDPAVEAILAIHNTVLNPTESLSFTGSPAQVELSQLNIKWDEEIRIRQIGTSIVVELYRLNWKLVGGETLLQTLGTLSPSRLFVVPGVVSVKIDRDGSWAGTVVYLRPRVARYQLQAVSDVDPITGLPITGWNIDILRTQVNAAQKYVTMPGRPKEGEVGPNADVQDDRFDALALSAFGTTQMTGGNGLPETPTGLNTGPTLSLIKLNYSEQPNGDVVERSEVYQWNGQTSSIGTWDRYTPL